MPFYTYILVSELNQRRYFGCCENIEVRLKNHNAGKVRSTKPYRPYRIHYSEIFATKTEALKREKLFKTFDGFKYLKQKGII